MTDSRPLDRALDAYLADGVNELADRVLEAALLDIDSTQQRRQPLAAWRFPAMTMQMRIATVALFGVVATGALLYVLRPGQSIGPPATPTTPPSIAAGPPTPAPTLAAWTVVQPPAYDHGVNGNVIRLDDGRVLLVGGGSLSSPLKVAEVYDPATQTWQATGSMSTPRSYAVAARLADGRILIAGGGGGGASAEIWDPATGRWAQTGSLNIARGQAFGTTLADGRVLIAGGGNQASSKTAEVYDPATGAWTRTGSLIVGRANDQIPTLLADGRVLVVGGFVADPREAELYDPATGKWTVTGRAGTPKGDEATAATLPDGRVLFFAGQPATTPEIYDPASGTWSPGPALLSRHGDYLASTALDDGRVLLVAGGEAGKPAPAEIFDPATSTWTSAGTTVAASFIRAAIRLPDGSVLVIGSTTSDIGEPLAELYRPN